MFSSSSNSDLFDQYKQQTYRLAFPFGVVIAILYIIIRADAGSPRFYFGIGMSVVLFILSILVWRTSGFLSAIEIVFYFAVVSHFFFLTYWALETLIERGTLTPESLADNLNSLGMWLIVFMVGGFLTLKNTHAKILLAYIFSGVTILAIFNIMYLVSVRQLSAIYLFQWILSLAALMIAILLIQRMGVLQQNQASTDSLTGLLNRRAMYRILATELERSARYRKTFSIIIFDLDNFKAINDTFGHLLGDQVLKELSKRIGNAIRQSDSLGRWGGEEFLLVLPETDGESARVFAERIRQMLKASQFGNVANVTASFGVTAFRESMGLEEMLHSADSAMYQTKQNGRDGVTLF